MMRYSPFPGLGDASTDSFPVDDLAPQLDALTATAGAPNATASVTGVLAQYYATGGAEGSLIPTQTLTQWITANSTLLLVSFAAVGAFMAILGRHRR